MKTSSLVLLIVCINVFIIVGDASFHLSTRPIDSVISSFMTTPANFSEDNPDTPYAYDFSSNNDGSYNITYFTANVPRNKVAASSGTGGSDSLGFIDGISIGWNLLLFVFDFVFKAVTFWFQIPGFPVVLSWLLAVPFAVAYLWAIFSLITGRDT